MQKPGMSILSSPMADAERTMVKSTATNSVLRIRGMNTMRVADFMSSGLYVISPCLCGITAAGAFCGLSVCCSDMSASNDTPKISFNVYMLSMLGAVCPVSHWLTVWRLTESLFASSSWDIPRSFRRACIRDPIVIAFLLPFVVQLYQRSLLSARKRCLHLSSGTCEAVKIK